MSEATEGGLVSCRETRRRFKALAGRRSTDMSPNPEKVDLKSVDFSGPDRAATELHLQTCRRCAREHRLFQMRQAALDLSGSPEPVRPDDNFFAALRAQMARGPVAQSKARASDESWAAAVSLTARQLIPAMAVLLILIIGATLWSNSAPSRTDTAEIRPRDRVLRVLFNQLYDYPEPTPDDVLETLVAVEEKENGK
jgi:hypothetical protein